MEGETRVEVRLFHELWKLEPRLAELGETQPGDGLSALDLCFTRPCKLKRWGYDCTPENTVAFASTGLEGEHFGFLVNSENVVEEGSPILLTAPAGDLKNLVVAEDFGSFLSAGLRRSHIALGQLAYRPDEALSILANPDWQPDADYADDYVSYATDEPLRSALDYIASELQLDPLDMPPDNFWDLQKRLLPKFGVSISGDDPAISSP